MLKKRERLTKKEFENFFLKGKRFHSKSLQLVYVPHQDFHGSAVVGKKVHKSAVQRNKIKRRLYAALYELKQKQKLQGIYIIIAKPSLRDVKYSLILPELAEVVGRTQK